MSLKTYQQDRLSQTQDYQIQDVDVSVLAFKSRTADDVTPCIAFGRMKIRRSLPFRFTYQNSFLISRVCRACCVAHTVLWCRRVPFIRKPSPEGVQGRVPRLRFHTRALMSSRQQSIRAQRRSESRIFRASIFPKVSFLGSEWLLIRWSTTAVRSS